MIDETHDPGRTSWVESANGHDAFPIQNLPHGVFSPDGGTPRGGIAIGNEIFDISAALEAGFFRHRFGGSPVGKREIVECVVGMRCGGATGIAAPCW
jgi:hypothetical protein